MLARSASRQVGCFPEIRSTVMVAMEIAVRKGAETGEGTHKASDKANAYISTKKIKAEIEKRVKESRRS